VDRGDHGDRLNLVNHVDRLDNGVYENTEDAYEAVATSPAAKKKAKSDLRKLKGTLKSEEASQ